VDAKAAARQDSENIKKKQADEAAANTAMGSLAVSQGLMLCGPGARATPFGDAVAMNTDGFAAAFPNQPADMSASGRMSPTLSTRSTDSGRSSPTVSAGSSRGAPLSAGDGSVSGASREVPALGALGTDVGGLTVASLANRAGTTTEEADLFLNAGFTFDLLSAPEAIALMTAAIKKRTLDQREGEAVDDIVAEFLEDGGSGEIPGFDGFNESVLRELLEQYGLRQEDFHDTVPNSYFFAGGWLIDHKPTGEKMAKVAEQVAELLVLGRVNTTIPPRAAAAPRSASGAPGGGAGGASSSSGPSRQTSGATGNRNRKTRNNKNKLAEDGLER